MQLLPTKLLSPCNPIPPNSPHGPFSPLIHVYNSESLSKKKRKYSWHKSLPPPTPRMHSLAYRMMWKLLRMAIKIYLIHLELFLTPDLPHRSFPQGLFPRAVHRLREERARQERKTVLTDMCLRHTGTHSWSPPSDLRSENTCLPRTGLWRADRGCLEESSFKDFMYQPPHSHIFPTPFRGVILSPGLHQHLGWS